MELQELAQIAELKVRSYSGRGMFGKECVGISADNVGDTLADLLQAAKDAEDDESVDVVIDALRDMRTDNLGRGVVVYFPSFEWKDEEDEDAEEEPEEAAVG